MRLHWTIEHMGLVVMVVLWDTPSSGRLWDPLVRRRSVRGQLQDASKCRVFGIFLCMRPLGIG